MNPPDTLQEMLRHVRARTGLDFSGYRRGTIERRVHNRMTSLAIGSQQDYMERLRADEREPAALVDRLTIKVSRFYRNAPAFDLLRSSVLPALARGRGAGAPVEVWSVGCARGEEAYTLAMLLEDAGLPGSVLATDIDAGALASAQEARYSEAACKELPGDLRRFLAPAGRGHVSVRDQVRGRVTFQLQDVCNAAPQRRFALVSCRNLLIYLGPLAQAMAFANLERALEPGGFLLLGEAEGVPLDRQGPLFPLHQRLRLFQARASEA